MHLVTKEHYLQLGIIKERKKGRPGIKNQKKHFRKYFQHDPSALLNAGATEVEASSQRIVKVKL